MKLRATFAFALLLALTSASADAQEKPTRSRGAYAGGITLTSIGSLFLTAGAIYGADVLVVAAQPASPGDGFGSEMLFFPALIAAGMTVVGLAMLVPGIVLIVKNHPRKIESLPLRDLHADLPAPRFVSVPILSGTFE